MNGMPCLNPNCKSEGRPHPHCHCYTGGESFAKGGEVDFCALQLEHEPQCEFFDGGGPIEDHIPHTVLKKGLHHTLTKQTEPKKHAGQGERLLNREIENPTSGPAKKSEETEALKKHLQFLDENPAALLGVGSNAGELAPEHATQIGTLAANAVNHFRGLRPTASQAAPLDRPAPTNILEEERYNRQLAVAENPLHVVHHTQNGTLLPDDVDTVKTLYPRLHQTLINKFGEQLIEQQSKGNTPSYAHRQGLSLLMGQPMDSTFSQPAMAAIIASAAPKTPQPANQPKTTKPTSADIDQFNKTDELYETPLESRQINKKD
jgi:hypothetical protein